MLGLKCENILVLYFSARFISSCIELLGFSPILFPILNMFAYISRASCTLGEQLQLEQNRNNNNNLKKKNKETTAYKDGC